MRGNICILLSLLVCIVAFVLKPVCWQDRTPVILEPSFTSVAGILDGLDTSYYEVGTMLYLDAIGATADISSEATSRHPLIGVILTSSTNGSMLIHANNMTPIKFGTGGLIWVKQ